jgi:hypothetical protein
MCLHADAMKLACTQPHPLGGAQYSWKQELCRNLALLLLLLLLLLIRRSLAAWPEALRSTRPIVTRTRC